MIVSGFLLERYPVLAQARHLVVDAAGPFLLENLVVHQHQRPDRRRRVLADESAVLARLLASADLVLCAHARQRDLTLGMMLATGAVLPELIDDDPALARMFLTVPFGPERRRRSGASRRDVPAASTSSGRAGSGTGSIRSASSRPWPGPARAASSSRPSSGAPAAPTRSCRRRAPRSWSPSAQRALGIASAIEIVDWVAHDERRARLARADVAVTLDPGGIEARFAFRTRLVDALAAGLPMIATTGELVADEAASHGAGFTVPPRKPEALAHLLRELADDPSRLAAARAHAPTVASRWAYEQTVAPLAAWCREPRRTRAGTPSLTSPRTNLLRQVRGRVQRALNSSTRAS